MRWRGCGLLALGGLLGALACQPATAPPASSTAPQPPAPAAAAGDARPAPTARALTPVILTAISRVTAILPHYVGLRAGLYAEEGLDLQINLMPTPTGIAAMMEGQIGYSASGASVIRAATSGRPVRLIAGGKNTPDWHVIVQPDVGRLEDLRGRRVGILAPTGAATLAIYEVLANRGVRKEEFDSIDLRTADGLLAGILARQVDAAPISPPATVHALRAGMKALVRTGDEVQMLQGGLGTSVQRLQERPAEVETMLRALVRSTRAMRENRALGIEVLASEFGLDPALADEMYADIALNFEPTASATDAVILREVAAQAEATGEELAVGVADVADFGPLRRAQRSLGLTPP
jgi:NitT/TauT family transport system substrate-binding protein